jgi:hypothetical protein
MKTISMLALFMMLKGVLSAQNVGIGTNAPTANLDISGSIRIRNNFPVKGSVLTSIDNNGNARWERPRAFKVGGTSNGGGQFIPFGQLEKVFFGTTPLYNPGSSFQGPLSQYIVPETGIYHFTVSLVFEPNDGSNDRTIHLIRERNGTFSYLATQRVPKGRTFGGKEQVYFSCTGTAIYEGMLQAGDLVWVAVITGRPVSLIDLNFITGITLMNISDTYFSGHLVTRL